MALAEATLTTPTPLVPTMSRLLPAVVLPPKNWTNELPFNVMDVRLPSLWDMVKALPVATAMRRALSFIVMVAEEVEKPTAKPATTSWVLMIELPEAVRLFVVPSVTVPRPI